ncbi:MAG: serine hydrolase domain-containing protein, partial [Gemmatimonadota bacterium]|nr:serine hydrolase domain-containing protein [Gemmatimonadota bacterium]
TPVGELLEQEIAEPNELHTMRAMFNSNGLSSNYERATPYKLQDLTEDTTAAPDTLETPPDSLGSNPSEPTGYGNSSWKVLGGGIETSTHDLARFGWNILDGRIVSDSVRDQRLWSSLTNGLKRWSDTTRNAPMVGLAWRVDNTPGRRRAWHSGSWSGARSLLYIWRDERLIVALMSNRRNHSRQGITTLANEIADAVRALAP